jgi:uncharacterized membrane protein
MLTMTIQATGQMPPAQDPGLIGLVAEFFSSPQHILYAYVVVLIFLWILARLGRQKEKDFSAEAQRVLDLKFQKGELDRATYEKFRQELSMRIKKE